MFKPMNKKIKNYIDVLFQDIPKSKKALELKEEMLSNMNERFNDYTMEGKSENQAYSLVISNLGDIDEMLKEVMPTEEFSKKADFYRTRNAKWKAIAIMLYILSPAVLIGSDVLFSSGEMGLLVMFLLIAIATGIMVFISSSTPSEFKLNDDKDDSNEYSMIKNVEDRNALKLFMSIYWSVITVTYFLVSFSTMNWHITWLIWVVGGIIESIIKSSYALIKNKKED